MKRISSHQNYIIGKGWRCGPFKTYYHKHAVISRVIKVLVWGARTQRNCP